MSRKKILSLDTSGLNALTYDHDSASLITRIKAGYQVRLTAMSINELIGTSDAGKRNRLLDTCQKLLPAGDCIGPQSWIIENLIMNFERNDKSGWQTLAIRSRDYESAIWRREIINDAISQKQSTFAKMAHKQFADLFGNARPEFDKVFKNGTPRSATFGELLAMLQVPGGAFWNFGVALYEHVARYKPTEDKIRAFVLDCPPFNALLLALVMAQFERTVRDLKTGESLRADRADLYMSVYLPYLDIFITMDNHQYKCLREIATVAKLGVEVVWYEDFRESFPAKH